MPFIGPSGELKTKPTQHSVKELRSLGIQPDVIVCRSRPADRPQPQGEDLAAVRRADQRRDQRRRRRLDLQGPAGAARARASTPSSRAICGIDAEPDLAEWEALVERIDAADEPVHDRGRRQVREPARRVPVASWRRCSTAGSTTAPTSRSAWVASDDLGGRRTEAALADVDGILVPGGFGVRGVEGKVAAVRYAREHGVPFLGHLPRPAVRGDRVRPQRRAASRAPTPASSIRRPRTPVIDLLPEQKNVTDLGGTMRLGAQPCHVGPGNAGRRRVRRGGRVRAAPPPLGGEPRLPRGAQEARARVLGHVARRAGSSRSSSCPDHPFFVAGQFHPELKSRPTHPHPLFRDFVGAAQAFAPRANAASRRRGSSARASAAAGMQPDSPPPRTAGRSCRCDVETWPGLGPRHEIVATPRRRRRSLPIRHRARCCWSGSSGRRSATS